MFSISEDSSSILFLLKTSVCDGNIDCEGDGSDEIDGCNLFPGQYRDLSPTLEYLISVRYGITVLSGKFSDN